MSREDDYKAIWDEYNKGWRTPTTNPDEAPTKASMMAKVQGEFNEWQLCPKCNGRGFEYTGTNDCEDCDLCNGKKIISKVTGEPPK